MSMAPSSLTLTAGTSGTLGVVIAGGKPTPVLQLCNSADASIASVAMNGGGCQVSAIAPGTTSITATSSGGQQASSTITVLALPPALLTFVVAPTTAALTVGQSVTLVATATAAAGATITYAATSSNTTIATASGAAASHTVTAIAPGSATITFTATASGPGLGTITRTVTVPVLVTVGGVCAPLAPVALTSDAFVTGTFAVGDCTYESWFIDHYVVTGPSRIVKVVLQVSGDLGLHVGPDFKNYQDASASGTKDYFFLPQGATTVRPLSRAPGRAPGSYQFGVFTQPEDVDDCRGAYVAGSIVTLQSVTDQSCRFSAAEALYDKLLLFAPGPCTITMKRVAGATSIVDPYIELGPPSINTVFAQNNDVAPGTNTDAQLTLSKCTSPAGGYFEVRAFGWNAQLGQKGGTGAYQLTVTYGPPA